MNNYTIYNFEINMRVQKHKLNIEKKNILKMQINQLFAIIIKKNYVLKTLFKLINICSLIIISFRQEFRL